jgi:hypothetical protein
LVILLLAGLRTSAAAVTVTARYEKTLGQSNADDKFSFVTGGARIAVDEQGNAYFGTPGGGSYLQKVSPAGKILWQKFLNVPGFQGTAVDDKYLYTCGSGYYGYVQLQRWSRDTGEPAAGWQYEWKDAKTPVNGVEPLKLPYALAVDDKYLFVADAGGDEIRRFDKTSGAEAPFPQRLLVVSPSDLAFTPQGTLLVLTKAAVIEVSKDGAPLRVPVIAELRGPTAIDVNRKSGALYVAEGGDEAELINRVRVFNLDDGKMTDEIGIGGEFSGRWHPQSFAFSSGAGDVALDGNGGFWVNGYGWRLGLCPLLTHFAAGAPPSGAPPSGAPPSGAPPSGAPPRSDLMLRGVQGSGIAVDPDLAVYVGGSYKIGWDDQLQWTSGLVPDGPAKLFPTTLTTWPLNVVWSDGKHAIIANPQQGVFFQVNARTGAATGKSVGSNGVIAGFCVVGGDLFFTTPGRVIQRTTLDLSAPQPFLTLPENAAPATGALQVSADQQRVYLSNGGEIACYGRDGGQLWKVKGNLGALWKGVLFTPNPDGAGVAALDAASGEKIAVFGDKAEDGRPPLGGIGGLATGGKDGADYLFIHTNARVLVYRISAG